MVSPAPPLDTFERFAAAHPYGKGLGASSNSARLRLVVAQPITRLVIDDWWRDSK